MASLSRLRLKVLRVMNDTENWTCPFGGEDPYTPILVTLDLAIAILAIIGNAIIICLIGRHSGLHTANNLFVLALAVADLLVAINIPFYVTFYFDVSFKCDRNICILR